MLPALLSAVGLGSAAATRVVAHVSPWLLLVSVGCLGYAHYLIWIRRRGHPAARWLVLLSTALVVYFSYGRVRTWLAFWLS